RFPDSRGRNQRCDMDPGLPAHRIFGERDGGWNALTVRHLPRYRGRRPVTAHLRPSRPALRARPASVLATPALATLALLVASTASYAQGALPFPRLVEPPTDASAFCASISALPGEVGAAPAATQARDSAATLAESAAVATL